MSGTSEGQEKMRDYQKAGIEVIIGKSIPISEPGNRYLGFEPGITTLRKGYVYREWDFEHSFVGFLTRELLICAFGSDR